MVIVVTKLSIAVELRFCDGELTRNINGSPARIAEVAAMGAGLAEYCENAPLRLTGRGPDVPKHIVAGKVAGVPEGPLVKRNNSSVVGAGGVVRSTVMSTVLEGRDSV